MKETSKGVGSSSTLLGFLVSRPDASVRSDHCPEDHSLRQASSGFTNADHAGQGDDGDDADEVAPASAKRRRGGGGPWGAYVHLHSGGRPFSREVVRELQQGYHRAKRDPQEFQRYREMGRHATTSHARQVCTFPLRSRRAQFARGCGQQMIGASARAPRESSLPADAILRGEVCTLPFLPDAASSDSPTIHSCRAAFVKLVQQHTEALHVQQAARQQQDTEHWSRQLPKPSPKRRSIFNRKPA